jgi:hypothetical protein
MIRYERTYREVSGSVGRGPTVTSGFSKSIIPKLLSGPAR